MHALLLTLLVQIFVLLLNLKFVKKGAYVVILRTAGLRVNDLSLLCDLVTWQHVSYLVLNDELLDHAAGDGRHRLVHHLLSVLLLLAILDLCLRVLVDLLVGTLGSLIHLILDRQRHFLGCSQDQPFWPLKLTCH